jgi:hypothetical protein
MQVFNLLVPIPIAVARMVLVEPPVPTLFALILFLFYVLMVSVQRTSRIVTTTRVVPQRMLIDVPMELVAPVVLGSLLLVAGPD